MSDAEIAPDYVSNAVWRDRPGRADTIDEIADQFERAPGAQQFWTQAAAAWPHRARGPRTSSFLRHAEGARLAG